MKVNALWQHGGELPEVEGRLNLCALLLLQDQEMSYLSWAVDVVERIMAKRIKSSPSDEIGIVFYGTVSPALSKFSRSNLHPATVNFTC